MSLTVVQAVCKGNTAAAIDGPKATFGSAPTQGNLMIALAKIDQAGTPASGANGWTMPQEVASGTGFPSYVALYYKYAGASEPAAQTFEANARHYYMVGMWEISGVTGTWASDFQALHANADDHASSTSLTSSSFNTANNNELVLLLAAGYSSSASPSITSSTGTSDASATSGSTDAFGNCDDAHAYHDAVATAGTAVSYALTQSVNNNTAISYGIVELNTPAGGTETSTASLGLSGIGYGAHASTNRATSSLVLTKVSYGVTTVDEHAGHASLALNHVSFAAAVQAVVTGTGALALSGVAIHAGAIDLGAAGAGAVHFATFGA